jgi:hypothetical protein
MATNRYAMHLFYTRHNYWYYQPPDDQTKWHPEFDEKRLGHVWSSDFVSWHAPCRPSSPCTPCNDIADTCALEVRPGMFDEFHVWAPTIVHPPGPTYYMFYTGVQKDLSGRENQRIGVARSTDLDNWTQADAPVLSVPQIPWANTNPSHTFGGSQQLRDPFVMEYPIGSGQYIMYFVSVDSRTDTLEDMAVGAARSTDLLNWDPLARPFAATERPTFQGHTHIVESDQPGAVVECRAGASG